MSLTSVTMPRGRRSIRPVRYRRIQKRTAAIVGEAPFSVADACRSAYRGHAPPAARFTNVGLRVALVSADLAAAEDAQVAEGDRAQPQKPNATQPSKVRLPKGTKPDVPFVFDFSALKLHSGNAKKDAVLRARCDHFSTVTPTKSTRFCDRSPAFRSENISKKSATRSPRPERWADALSTITSSWTSDTASTQTRPATSMS